MLQEQTVGVGSSDMTFELADVAVVAPQSSQRAQSAPKIRRAAIMGNFPPRMCGLATFTRDMYACLSRALPKAGWRVVAMNDPNGAYDYPDVVTDQIPQNDPDAYRRLAASLNADGIDVMFVQHEFGIFGGPAGEYLIECLERLNMPVVTTLHTVLETPNDDQKRVMAALIRVSSTLITMAERGAKILREVYKVPDAQILVVPHGAPSRPLGDTERFKEVFGVGGQKTLMTFGLLSPNKGIETIIRALPDILDSTPDLSYLIVGATHPHLVASQGEAYRDSLMDMARQLGVEDHIVFVNRFMDDAELIDILQATDIYVTPYLTETQITSGTLSYALALGRPVVSTPYWHAAEALADGVGIICPFEDSAAFAREISNLLTSDEHRAAMSQRAYDYARPSRWSAVADSYVNRAAADIDTGKIAAGNIAGRPVKPERPRDYLTHPPSWEAIERMSDDCGIFQHGKFRLADRNHGYCTDDNCRALSLIALQSGWVEESATRDRLAYTYAAFVNHAWTGERFRNFMDYGRHWLDDGGSDDCCARTLESLIDTVRSNLPDDLRLWAKELAQRVIPQSENWTSQRSRAILIRVLSRALGHVGDEADIRTRIRELSRLLRNGLSDHSDGGHAWFEPALSYDNARLPEGLILAGETLRDQSLIDEGADTLSWLMAQQTCTQGGHFRPVPTSRFDQGGQTVALFDQQSLEVQATLNACLTAWRVTQDTRWKDEAFRAFAWFHGENDHGLSLITADGGCFDGLTPEGCNQNQGAESLLAYHLSWTAMMANL
ncbi:glycosyl transferase [Asticcacaulis endophyticus]|uniref:Glycosyl transferase n=2 Tax=Asticcacaulis endophyticus TaxID=1395890 RepID=A0A918PXW0_9CAUL|nr:glycosyl transferase [Asticcacaulis endophyticus]